MGLLFNPKDFNSKGLPQSLPKQDKQTPYVETRPMPRYSNHSKASSIVRSLIGWKELVVLAVAGYSAVGWHLEWVPFPGTPNKAPTIEVIEVEPTSLPKELPALQFERQAVNSEVISYAQQLSGGDGIFDATERDAACKAAAQLDAQSGEDSVSQLNNLISDIGDGLIPNVRKSSGNLKGCSKPVASPSN